jgi:inhibitor of KinA sporulation pathway (predicted exonuclease)
MNIYEIDRNFADTMEEIMLVFDEETGEVTDIDKFEELKRRLNELQEERNTKISNVACWYKQLCAEAEAIKAEKMALAKRQQTAEKKAENLKKYLEYALQGEKFKDARVSISYRKSKSVAFSDNFDCRNLPEEFQKITYEPKKTEIKKAIEEDGIDFPGVEIVEKTSMQIK